MRAQSYVLALACAGVLACSLSACASVANRGAVVGERTAEGAVSLPGGGELRLEETRGHVVVLAFFTTWCPSSGPTLRAVDELRARNAANNLEVIAVGEGESAAEVRSFAMRLGVRARVAFDQGGALATQLGLPTVPAVVVIDRDGIIRHVQAGYHGEEDRAVITRAVTALLEAART
jgi:cytochrome c biogenesis protein CcmG/thiol:disulfide interchange protein DsbE